MRRTIQGMLVIAVILDITYWSLWFVDRDSIASEHNQAYYDFENAFPLADLWLGIACAAALVTLARRQPAALFWLLCSGSAALYLGCMDLLYDLEHGIFAKGFGGAFEAAIVVVTWIFALTVLRWSWRNRAALLSGAA
ncbi:hypothetical protein F0U44_17090 [Nocardioides humilatus]|uniref:Uncharacterized protein n=1 Tax=Nocardioides humilatus TaxID=2607660 RepID=A0A5B1L8F1_9ACTN|nr:hypothetical protein [Nocardioides humilatus]KAA1416902.1 hypothetical protein F0U44_17090 [Nocardioides humilatus]